MSREPTNFGSSAGPHPSRRSPGGRAQQASAAPADAATPPPTMRFARAAQTMAEAVRRRGLLVPDYRSPPRTVGVTRSIQRRPDGSCTVAVGLKGRHWSAVVADMIEGVVVANQLESGPAGRLRSELWEEIDGVGTRAA